MAEENIIKNDALIEAVAQMREDFNQQTQNKVINTALRCEFLVPANISRNTQLVQDKDNHLKFQDKPQARFMLIKHKTNGTFFPVFTDKEQFDKLEKKEEFSAVKMKFADIAALTEQSPAVVGFVIDPMGINLPFTKEMLASIRKTLQAARERQAAAQNADAPSITVTEGENG